MRLASKYRPGVPILVLTKNQACANACSMIRAAVPLVLGEQEGVLDRSGLVRLVSKAATAAADAALLFQALFVCSSGAVLKISCASRWC